MCGITDEASRARLESAAGSIGLGLETIESGGSREEPAEADWDVLILGDGSEPADFADRLRAIGDDHPSGLVIAVRACASDKDRRRLFEAGALDVLAPDADYERYRLALIRATILHHRAVEQRESTTHQVITQLAAGVNHEINNPLTGLMGTAELILFENKDLSQKVTRDIKTILAEARRIQTIVRRLKDLDELRIVPYEGEEEMVDLVGAGESEEQEHERPDSEAEIFQTPRLLVVDDNPLILDLIERYLTDRFSIEHALCATDALSKLRSGRFDLVLTDLAMPEMDGLELLRAIRRINPTQRVLVATGAQSQAKVEESLAEGAIGWVRKPIDFERLEQQVWKALKAEARFSPNSA